jgi:hypothetical protein
VFFDPMNTMRQLFRAVAQPRKPAATGAVSTAAGGIGCCPACHELISVQPLGPSESGVCPRCGRLFRSLDPLGADTSSGPLLGMERIVR